MAVMTRRQSQNLHYPGKDIQLFAEAKNWKQCVSNKIQPRLGQRVLEVGAGIGGMTRYLDRGESSEWVCLEPDARLLSQLQRSLLSGDLPDNCQPVHGTIFDIAQAETFDSILYIDVIEHIENDTAELQRASEHLRPGGALILLAPAHQLLYSPFDRAIGHARRYSKKRIEAVSPPQLQLTKLCYLDSAGLLATFANRFILRQDTPSIHQIRFWDHSPEACSRWLDPLLRYSIGKSLFAIWTQPKSQTTKNTNSSKCEF